MCQLHESSWSNEDVPGRFSSFRSGSREKFTVLAPAEFQTCHGQNSEAEDTHGPRPRNEVEFLSHYLPMKISSRNPFGQILGIQLDTSTQHLSCFLCSESGLLERQELPLMVAM